MLLRWRSGMRGGGWWEVGYLIGVHRQEWAQLGAPRRVGPQRVERLLEARVLGDGPADEGGDEHADEASLPLGHLVDRRGCRRCEEVLVGGDALVVVDVQEAADGPSQLGLVGAVGEDGGAGGGLDRKSTRLNSSH